jgi:hypothetical protein
MSRIGELCPSSVGDVSAGMHVPPGFLALDRVRRPSGDDGSSDVLRAQQHVDRTDHEMGKRRIVKPVKVGTFSTSEVEFR